ncbi:MAG: hypothetical protein MPL62_04475 [Alphaproteobacteria bacterium]|nr:hypothetical protein [Alphaproteobacteria bacterium]
MIIAAAAYFYFQDPLKPVAQALDDAGKYIQGGIDEAKAGTEKFQEQVHEDYIGPAAEALGYSYDITHTDKLFSTVEYTPIADKPQIHPLSFIAPIGIANAIANFQKFQDRKGRPVQGPPAPLAVRAPSAAASLRRVYGGGI